MKKLTFYHQKRRDGGLRTGVEVNDERILERFEPGGEPMDSALLWFVDVRCSASDVPTEIEAIRHWLLKKGEVICPVFHQLADELQAGIDSEWPLKRVVPSQEGGEMAVYCSAIRRMEGRDIAQILSDLEKNWPTIIKSLASYEYTVAAHG